jgi:hypothetical protein
MATRRASTLLAIALSLLALATGELVVYDFVVTASFGAPDGVERPLTLGERGTMA